MKICRSSLIYRIAAWRLPNHETEIKNACDVILYAILSVIQVSVIFVALPVLCILFLGGLITEIMGAHRPPEIYSALLQLFTLGIAGAGVVAAVFWIGKLICQRVELEPVVDEQSINSAS